MFLITDLICLPSSKKKAFHLQSKLGQFGYVGNPIFCPTQPWPPKNPRCHLGRDPTTTTTTTTQPISTKSLRFAPRRQGHWTCFDSSVYPPESLQTEITTIRNDPMLHAGDCDVTTIYGSWFITTNIGIWYQNHKDYTWPLQPQKTNETYSSSPSSVSQWVASFCTHCLKQQEQKMCEHLVINGLEHRHCHGTSRRVVRIMGRLI